MLTLPPINHGSGKWVPPILVSFHLYRVILHFHDYGRKGSHVLSWFFYVFLASEVSDTEFLPDFALSTRHPRAANPDVFLCTNLAVFCWLLRSWNLKFTFVWNATNAPSLKHFVQDACPNEGVAYKEKSRHGGDSCFSFTSNLAR